MAFIHLHLHMEYSFLAVEDFAELSGDTIERIAAFPNGDDEVSRLRENGLPVINL